MLRGYLFPPTRMLLHQGGSTSGGEPGIEYEAESEGELDELGVLVGGGQGGTAPSRMRMLHQLWALGVPRRRGP